MSYDSWKTTEPDREPSPGDHLPLNEHCHCDGCAPAEHLNDSDIETILADAIKQEDFELVDLCETALKMIVGPSIKKRAVAMIEEILKERGQ